MKYLKSILLFAILASVQATWAQDVQFTQLNAVPLQINPALTGNTITSRATVHYRSQWAGVGSGYNTLLASFDHQGYNSPIGWGVMLLQDNQGALGPSTTELQGSLAYSWQLSSGVYARAGLQGGLVSQSIDPSGLLFVEQFDNSGLIKDSHTEALASESYLYPDLSSGIVLYGRKWWAGLAVHHLIPRRQSFFEEVFRPLARRYSLVGGLKIPLLMGRVGAKPSQDTYIAPMIQYRMQGEFDQMDVGVYAVYEPITVGIWYRGLPLLKSYAEGIPNRDALAFMVGLKLKGGLSVTYSYDRTISDFANYRTGGAHEIGLSFQWAKGKKAKQGLRGRQSGYRFEMPCPLL